MKKALPVIFVVGILQLFILNPNPDESSPSLVVAATRSLSSAGKAIIAYSGDLKGSLDPCACGNPPSGGVARRATFLRDYRRGQADTPILLVETGNELKHSDALDEPANRRIVEAFDLLGSHAVNTTIEDLRRLLQLAESGLIPREPQSRYVSSIVEPPLSAPFAVKPFVVQTVVSDLGANVAKFGILGASIDSGELPQPYNVLKVDQALRRHLAEVGPQSDLVILLARLPDAELVRIAQTYPEIDVIINGSSVAKGRELAHVGNTVIVESASGGSAVGLLHVEWDQQGRLTKSRNEIVPLPYVIQDWQPMAALAEKARQDSMAFEEEIARKSGPPTTPSIFAGSASCRKCHAKAFKIWETSAHARAFMRLKPANEFNRDCLRCHVTGYEIERGFSNVLQNPDLAGVNCEACHSPSIDHAGNPENFHPGIGAFRQMRRRVNGEQCIRCHTRDNSPKFDFAQYWKKIEH